MAPPQEHYDKAEKALELIDETLANGEVTPEGVMAGCAIAQAHATLALAPIEHSVMPNGDVVEAVRRRVTPEVVTGAEAAELPAGSIVVQCEPDGTPILGCTFVVGDPDEEHILLPLMPQRVLYRAPELDSDRPLAAQGEPPR